MQSAPLKPLEMQPAVPQTGHLVRSREVHLIRENLRLIEDNERLRAVCTDLAASAELWIRLYEAALGRVGKHVEAGGQHQVEQEDQDGSHGILK